ncbi:unnamed protein product [Porites evermanni]|uniref:Uncharacterized protein n=1 Tax=Porites evermanni TaxID=104178 RepID=A0ABN8MJ40_9CNID|nr:unnamed protein product [Porites evermanni]
MGSQEDRRKLNSLPEEIWSLIGEANFVILALTDYTLSCKHYSGRCKPRRSHLTECEDILYSLRSGVDRDILVIFSSFSSSPINVCKFNLEALFQLFQNKRSSRSSI